MPEIRSPITVAPKVTRMRLVHDTHTWRCAGQVSKKHDDDRRVPMDWLHLEFLGTTSPPHACRDGMHLSPSHAEDSVPGGSLDMPQNWRLRRRVCGETSAERRGWSSMATSKYGSQDRAAHHDQCRLRRYLTGYSLVESRLCWDNDQMQRPRPPYRVGVIE